MLEVSKIINPKNPEGYNCSFKNSKFSKFNKKQLKEFVRENFLQTSYSEQIPKSEHIKYVNSAEKKLLIICCVQIELTRTLFYINHYEISPYLIMQSKLTYERLENFLNS